MTYIICHTALGFILLWPIRRILELSYSMRNIFAPSKYSDLVHE
jgi:hypothetical protein